MTKKGNNIIGALVIILGIFAVIAMLVFGIKKEENSTTKYFNDVDKVVASEIYEKILELDEDTYPATPKAVLDTYLGGYRLLYGDKIKDLSIVDNILEKQRILLSNKILEGTSLEKQKEIVLNNIANLKNQKIKVTQVFIEENNKLDGDTEEMTVKIQDNMLQQYEYIYTLKKENENIWKIASFKNIAVNSIK